MEENGRKYIRHPVDIPIEMEVVDGYEKQKVKDISEGGLCFVCDHSVNKGDCIQIVISMCKPIFNAEGIVRWCRTDGSAYRVGLVFQDKAVAYAIRMVEQVCHIEDYRRQVLIETGKKLNSGQAAKEWIEKYAGDFPSTWFN